MRRARWPGAWKVVCDVCGFQFPSDDIRDRWDGLKVCDKDWEMRHPQDFLRVKPERVTPAYVRTEPTVEYVSVTYPFPLDEATH